MKTYFSALQIQSLCHDLEKELNHFQLKECLSSNQSEKLLFIFQSSKKQKLLFFCFKAPFVRFHFVQQFPKNFIKRTPLEEYLKEASLKSVQVINEDRIVRFHFTSSHQSYYLYTEFFSKFPNYYLTNLDNHIIYSLFPLKQDNYSPPSPRRIKKQETLPILNHLELEAYYTDLEKSANLSKEKQVVSHYFHKQLDKVINRKSLLKTNLEKSSNWLDVQHQADLIKAHFNTYQKGDRLLNVWDWQTNQHLTISISPKHDLQKEMSLRYNQAKKLARGIVPLQNQLIQLDKVKEELEKQLVELEHLTLEEIKEIKQRFLIQKTKKILHQQKGRKALSLLYLLLGEKNPHLGRKKCEKE